MQQGLVWGKFIKDTIKLTDPKNLQFGANSLYISSTMPKL